MLLAVVFSHACVRCASLCHKPVSVSTDARELPNIRAYHEGMGKVIVLGSINIDTVIRAPRYPRLGETLMAYGMRTMPGGKGANQAVAAHRAGAETLFLACVGSDAQGEFYRKHLRASGLNTDFVRTAPGPTGSATIIVEDSGDNAILFDPGANAAVGEPEIETILNLARPGDVLSIVLEIQDQVALQALAVAQKRGVTTLLNPSPWTQAAQSLADSADIVIVNERESSRLNRVDERVCITFGAQGALWRGVHAPARRIKAVDTTGAGDTFAGTLAAAVARDLPTEEALRTATEAATDVCERDGAQDWQH